MSQAPSLPPEPQIDESRPCESIDGVPIDWSGRGTSHVDYQRSEEIPLKEGRYLGFGIHGGVYETSSNGVLLAWKRKHCRHRLGTRERREIDIIKRLSHPHVIRLIGTYMRPPILGLLLWPVATCDLATFLEDTDWLRKLTVSADLSDDCVSMFHKTHDQDRDPTFQSLGLGDTNFPDVLNRTIGYLEQTIGCIASAVAYLHRSGIKHKDLKPSNILLSADGLWVTDFGSATDFSVLTSSVTDNGERGTPKYFAPEVADYEPSGSASDIFAMGCIFLEIITLCMGYSLDTTASLRSSSDHSFQANIGSIIRWFDTEDNLARRAADEHLVGLIRHMIRPAPQDRPKADHVEEQIAMIGGLAKADGGSEFCRPCCGLGMFAQTAGNQLFVPEFPKQVELIWGNTHSTDDTDPGWHRVMYYIQVGLAEVVEKVHMYMHQSFDETYFTQSEPPFVFQMKIYGAFDVSAYVVLRQGWVWDHPTAQSVPNEAHKRMLPLSCSLTLSNGGAYKSMAVPIMKLGPGFDLDQDGQQGTPHAKAGSIIAIQPKDASNFSQNPDQNSNTHKEDMQMLQDLNLSSSPKEQSLRGDSISVGFSDNIAMLAIAMRAPDIAAQIVLLDLIKLVASCVMVDIVRRGYEGHILQVFEEQYIASCDRAVEKIYNSVWPCAFRNIHGGRCARSRQRHQNRHQNRLGVVVGLGPYKSEVTSDEFRKDWVLVLKNSLIEFQQQLGPQKSSLSYAAPVIQLHREKVAAFYDHAGGASRFFNQRFCLCCLRGLAEHPLHCGHMLCTPCIKDYGVHSLDFLDSYVVEACPLHSGSTKTLAPTKVYFKPPLAGLCILSLDGGGIRGIVILEVLRQIQSKLGNGIPIREFFDLIVGTSTGGILALALGTKNWSVDHCIEVFLQLVEQAYVPKFSSDINEGTPKYRTGPFEEALRTCFGDDAIFGRSRDAPPGRSCKVAVTSADENSEQAVIFTNYNRREDKLAKHRLVRPFNPKKDLKSWEAARATSAAPLFFEPFRNTRTGQTYIDGTVFHNNPVRVAASESRLLWPDTKPYPPDILLSIGTGRHVAANKSPADATRKKSSLESIIHNMKEHVDRLLDTDSIWSEFTKNLPRSVNARYIRVNPETKDPLPRTDESSKAQALHEVIRLNLHSNEMQTIIVDIARRLIASSFYFNQISLVRHADGYVTIKGSIHCKFAAGSDNIRKLGEYLRKHESNSYQPYFLVRESDRDETAQSLSFTARIIKDLTNLGTFNMGLVVINLASESSVVSIDLCLTRGQPGNPISGFPRSLAAGEPIEDPTPAEPRSRSPESGSRTLPLRHARSSIAGSAVNSYVDHVSREEYATSLREGPLFNLRQRSGKSFSRTGHRPPMTRTEIEDTQLAEALERSLSDR